MINIRTLKLPIDDKKRRQIIFDGGIIIFKSVKKMLELVDFTKKLIQEKFAGYDPLSCHTEMSSGDFLNIVFPLQREYTAHPTTKKLWKDALIEIGIDPEETFSDWSPLRVQPPIDLQKHNALSGYKAHRDSWYSNLNQQTNFWTPIYPLNKDTTMTFYPTYFDKIVENNSEGWSLETFRQKRKQVRELEGARANVSNVYPMIFPSNPLSKKSAIRLICEPGDIINFSGNHLHESSPNISGVARFSTEIRTIHYDDTVQGYGAPNVDGESLNDSLEDFYRLSDEKAALDVFKKIYPHRKCS